MATATPPAAAGLGEFAALLGQEESAIGQFVTLLQQEQAALTAGQVDSLDALVAAKNPLVQQLNRIADERRYLLQVAGFSNDRAGFHGYLAAHGTAEMRAAWERLQSLAHQAQELNGLNGQLISQRLQGASGALQVLLQRHQAGSGVYGPDGQKQAGTGSRLIDSV